MKCYNGILHVRLRITSIYMIFLEFISVTNKIPTNISDIIARDDNLARVMLRNVNSVLETCLAKICATLLLGIKENKNS